MKRFGIILSVLVCQFLAAGRAHAAWTNVDSSTTATLISVFFIDSNTGWVCASNGAILKSTNGGTIWQSQTSGTTEILYDIRFANSTTGIAVGSGGTALKTTDGGTTWSPINVGGGGFSLYSAFWTSASDVWVSGAFGTVRKSTDAGTTWTNGDSGGGAAGRSLYNLFFINTSTGWAATLSGNVLQTFDAGATWTPRTVHGGSDIRSVYFVDASTGWAVDLFGKIFKSTDSGNSWAVQYSTTAYLLSASFVDEDRGWVVGTDFSNSLVFRTIDSGSNFTVDATTTASILYKVFFQSASLGFAVGTGGAILRGTFSTSTSTFFVPDQEGSLKPLNNLFNPSRGEATIIQYGLRKSGKVAIRIYTMQGRLVRALLDDTRDAGTYQDVNWDGRNDDGETVASGIYLLHIEAPNFSHNQKIAVIR